MRYWRGLCITSPRPESQFWQVVELFKKMIREIELENLGTANKNEVRIRADKGNFSFYFSYNTLVGIWCNWHDGKKSSIGRAIRQNDWSTTTGKFLNELEPDKKLRLTREEFDNQLNFVLELMIK